jgi:phosphonate transport system permease protein
MDNRARLIRNTLLIGLVVVAVGWSYRVTEIDFVRLFSSLPKARVIVTDFLTPDIVTRESQTTTIEISFPIPCGSAPEAEIQASGPRLVPGVKCATARDKFTLEGFELAPDSAIAVRWQFPDGRQLTAARTSTDSGGHFSIQLDAKPIASSLNGVASRLQVDTSTPVGGLMPSQSLKEVIQLILVTIFMALLSTTIATIVAAPLSFLAASNITRRGWLGTGVYYATRSVFNLTRAYEPLVMATVFGFWLGFGPLPGVLALTVVTIASLGKMFSEAVENIDPGPIEALTATGSNRLQTIVFSVIPQIVPDFVSYIIYHWDINVRISTIIGFVGGGGIGFYLSERINGFHYNQAGTAIWAIVIVVWAMDFLSAEVRKRLT